MSFVLKFVCCLILVSSCPNVEATLNLPATKQTSAAGHSEAGNRLAKNGQYKEALEQLNLSIEKDPASARAYRLRGHVYYAMEEYEKSLADLEKVVALVPESANAYCDRGIAYSMVGRHGAALTDIDHALQLKPSSSFAKREREVILERASNPN